MQIPGFTSIEEVESHFNVKINEEEKEKYKSLREEIEKRREEIRKGEFLTHEEVWDV